MSWTVGGRNVRFGLAARYAPTQDVELKAKVDHESKVAFAISHSLTHQVSYAIFYSV